MQTDTTPKALDPIDFERIVEKIRRGDQAGIDAFYRVINRGMRFLISRQLRPEVVDDTVQDAFVMIIAAIQKGQLRHPAALMGFSRTIVKCLVVKRIHELTLARKDSDLEREWNFPSRAASPEQLVARSERTALMQRVLMELSTKDREVLVRYYLHEQNEEQICKELSLTATQFRLLKSRAKSRFGELGRKKLSLASLYSSGLSAQQEYSSSSQTA
jgi:RNA polymerase sigma-70 factor (ECF subfamily)